MKKVEYINRYGDHITFTETDNNTVEMAGFVHFRYSGEMVDPSGGPYIQVGADVGRYFEDGKKRKVKSIELSTNKAILKI